MTPAATKLSNERVLRIEEEAFYRLLGLSIMAFVPALFWTGVLALAGIALGAPLHARAGVHGCRHRDVHPHGDERVSRKAQLTPPHVQRSFWQVPRRPRPHRMTHEAAHAAAVARQAAAVASRRGDSGS